MTAAVFHLSKVQDLKESLYRFVSWWRDELADLVPSQIRERCMPDRSKLKVKVTKTGIVFHFVGAGEKNPRTLSLSLEKALKSSPPKTLFHDEVLDLVEIHIAPDLLLRREIYVPPGSREKISGMVALQLESLVPLRPDRVAFAFVMGKQEDKKVPVTLFIMRRDRLDPVFTMLSKAGIQTKRLAVMSNTSAGRVKFDIRAPRSLRRRRSPGAFVRTPLGTTLAVWGLLLAGLAGYLQVRETNLERLSASMEADLAGTAQKIAAFEAYRAKAGHLSHLLQRPSLAAVVEELSMVLPKEAWVQALTLQGERVVVEGYARDPALLLGPLETSTMFSDVRLAAIGETGDIGRGSSFKIVLNYEQTPGKKP